MRQISCFVGIPGKYVRFSKGIGFRPVSLFSSSVLALVCRTSVPRAAAPSVFRRFRCPTTHGEGTSHGNVGSTPLVFSASIPIPHAAFVRPEAFRSDAPDCRKAREDMQCASSPCGCHVAEQIRLRVGTCEWPGVRRPPRLLGPGSGPRRLTSEKRHGAGCCFSFGGLRA